MNSIYEEYEKDYKVSLDNLKTNLKNLKDSDNHDVNNGLIKEIDNLSREVADRLKDMDLEIRVLDSVSKKEYTTRMVQYRSEYNSIQSDYQRVKEQKQRSTLIGNSSEAQRQRMITTVDKLASQQEKIYNAQLTAASIEGDADTIITELQKNREIIEGIKSKTDEFQGTIDQADKTLGSMQRRANREKNCIIS